MLNLSGKILRNYKLLSKVEISQKTPFETVHPILQALYLSTHISKYAYVATKTRRDSVLLSKQIEVRITFGDEMRILPLVDV